MSTSALARVSIIPIISDLKTQVLEFVRDCPLGATCDEIEQGTDIRHQTASARIRELTVQGALIKTIDRRPTRSGRGAVVYVVAGGVGA